MWRVDKRPSASGVESNKWRAFLSSMYLYLQYLVEGLRPQQRHGEAEGVEGQLHAPRRRGKVRVLVGLVPPRPDRLGVRVLLGEELERDEQLTWLVDASNSRHDTAHSRTSEQTR